MPSKIDKEWIRSKADELAIDAGCWFDLAAAERVRRFFCVYLKHSKGQFAGQRFELLDWEWSSLIAPLFGWRQPDGSRRYRKASAWIAKKNGKSSLGAGLVIYGVVADNEPGAHVFGAAVDRDQASVVYEEVESMILQSPEIARKLTIKKTQKIIAYEEKRSFYQVLSKDSKKSGHGKNAHMVVIDEVHVVDREMYQTLRYAGAARRQPLMIEISTAGNQKESLGYERYLYAKKVAKGEADDPSLLPFIAEADSNDVWADEEQWQKANPSLGHTISMASFRSDFREASQGSPDDKATFCQLRLNIWQDAANAWLDMDRWLLCGEEPIDWDSLRGHECYCGLDLASTTDLASACLLFPLADGRFVAKWHYWAPENACVRRERKNRLSLRHWAQQGHVTLTPGDTIDYDLIRRSLNEAHATYRIREIAIDRWNATQIATQLQGDGFEVVGFGQGFASMSAPTKELEKLVLSRSLLHGNNPVSNWCAGNVVTVKDAAGNIKPSKEKSTEKIDGIVALIMALGRSALQTTVAPSISWV